MDTDWVTCSVCVRDPERAVLPKDKHKAHRGAVGTETTQRRACYVTGTRELCPRAALHTRLPRVVPCRAFLSSDSARMAPDGCRQRNPLASSTQAHEPHGTKACRGEGAGEQGSVCENRPGTSGEGSVVCPSVRNGSRMVAAINDPE